MKNESLEIYKPEIEGVICTGFTTQTLVTDCLFTEGPIWNKEGFYLFSDIPANVVYKIIPGSPKEIYIANSGTSDVNNPDLKSDQTGSNGLAYLQGELLVCQHGGHGIARWDGSRLQPFIHTYNSRPFNSPNDLIVHSDGRVFFSDPPYGLKDGQLNQDKFQPAGLVYVYDKDSCKVVCDKYQYPNGVVLSPDESVLYICSNKPFDPGVLSYDADTYEYKGVFAAETSDGIECDKNGNIYLCNKAGILILNVKGEKLGLISLSTVPSNCCWGGAEGKDLLITARERVYLICDLQV